MLSYEELLDKAESLGLYVSENVPLRGVKGLIYGREILLREDLTRNEMRVVLDEEITHFEVNGNENIIWNDKEELRCHKRLAKHITLFELIDAIITCGYDASFYSVAEELDVPEWFLKDVLEQYSRLPLHNFTYRGYLITFEPFTIRKLEE